MPAGMSDARRYMLYDASNICDASKVCYGSRAQMLGLGVRACVSGVGMGVGGCGWMKRMTKVCDASRARMLGGVSA